MSKAYNITAVDHGDSVDGKARTLGVFFDRDMAQKILDADINNYIDQLKKQGIDATETELAVWMNDTHGCEWNIEDIDISIPLTALQMERLNGLGAEIQKGEDDYFSYEDLLSDEEKAYLIDWLKNVNIAIDSERGMELRGELAREFFKAHDAENK